MFGFIKRTIRAFTDSFKAEADEEPVPEANAEEPDAQNAAVLEGADAVRSDIIEPTDEVRAARDAHAPAAPREEPSSSSVHESASTAPTEEPPLSLESDTTESAQTHRSSEEARSHRPAAPASAKRRRTHVSDTVRADEDVSGSVEKAVGTETAHPDDEHEAPRSRPAAEDAHANLDRAPRAPPATKLDESQRVPKPSGFGKLMGALTKRSLSEDQFERIFTDLEIGLLEANTAYDAVQAVKENLRAQLTGERVSRFSAADDVARALKESITALFAEPEDLVALAEEHEPLVIMLIGINGSGKTTTAAKLARAYQRAGKRPVLAAADTFRAAAIQQLEAHAKALDCRIIKHDYGADPTAVAFDAVSHAKSGKADVVLIDTAGRLHSNENLLKELEKLKRVIKPHRIIFVGESIAGNDLIEQAETFDEKIGIDGIILTKTDVDESGGGMLSVSHVTGKPIDYLGGGQGYDDLTFFSRDVVARLLGLE